MDKARYLEVPRFDISFSLTTMVTMNDVGENRRCLYQTIVDEQHRYLDRLQGRVPFYTGLLTTLIGGSVVAFLQLPQYANCTLVFVGGMLVSLTSCLARRGTRSAYRGFTECISTRTKIEHDLGFDQPRGTTGEANHGNWFELEPYLASRHLCNRKGNSESMPYKSSEEYEEAMQKNCKSILGITTFIFIVTLIIGILLMLTGIVFLILTL